MITAAPPTVIPSLSRNLAAPKASTARGSARPDPHTRPAGASRPEHDPVSPARRRHVEIPFGFAQVRLSTRCCEHGSHSGHRRAQRLLPRLRSGQALSGAEWVPPLPRGACMPRWRPAGAGSLGMTVGVGGETTRSNPRDSSTDFHPSARTSVQGGPAPARSPPQSPSSRQCGEVSTGGTPAGPLDAANDAVSSMRRG